MLGANGSVGIKDLAMQFHVGGTGAMLLGLPIYFVAYYCQQDDINGQNYWKVNKMLILKFLAIFSVPISMTVGSNILGSELVGRDSKHNMCSKIFVSAFGVGVLSLAIAIIMQVIIAIIKMNQVIEILNSRRAEQRLLNDINARRNEKGKDID